MCTKNHNHMMYSSWETDKNILSFWAIFCPFTSPPPSNDPECQNFEKKWKKWLETLSFYTFMCTINEDHMIYGSWNIRCNRQKFSSFWAIFWPFSPLTTWKIKILKLKETPGDIIILHICTINDHLHHMVPEIWSATDRIFCHSWPLFALLPPLTLPLWT